MAITILLSIDLNNVNNTQRNQFNDYMKNKKWINVSNVTTTYKAKFNEDVSLKAAVETTKNDIVNAVGNSNITNYSFVFLPSEYQVIK